MAVFSSTVYCSDCPTADTIFVIQRQLFVVVAAAAAAASGKAEAEAEAEA